MMKSFKWIAEHIFQGRDKRYKNFTCLLVMYYRSSRWACNYRYLFDLSINQHKLWNMSKEEQLEQRVMMLLLMHEITVQGE